MWSDYVAVAALVVALIVAWRWQPQSEKPQVIVIPARETPWQVVGRDLRQVGIVLLCLLLALLVGWVVPQLF